MSRAVLATKQNLTNSFASSPEESEIQTGSHFRLGVLNNREMESISYCLAATRPVFAWNSTSSLMILLRRGSLSWIRVGHRTGDIWHIWVRGIPAGQLYGYRIGGPYQPEEGHRFNPHRLLLDPYARAIANVKDWDFAAARGYDSSSRLTDLSIATVDNAAASPKCIFTRDNFDWEMDSPPKHSASDTVVYETHVRGFTIHPSSKVERAGTFAGLTEKIPYLQDLGVTAIELMPVLEFNENESQLLNPITRQRLKNYWGYNPVAYFAPKQSYSFEGSRWQQISEFREMVKAFHRAGIEVILDIVLNHTAESNELGPTICLRGIENSGHLSDKATSRPRGMHCLDE